MDIDKTTANKKDITMIVRLMSSLGTKIASYDRTISIKIIDKKITEKISSPNFINMRLLILLSFISLFNHLISNMIYVFSVLFLFNFKNGIIKATSFSYSKNVSPNLAFKANSSINIC